jgi:alcohol dehydrogenase
MTYQFIMPTKIIVGSGSVGEVSKEVEAFGGKTVLIVTDPGLSNTGLPTSIADHLKAKNIQVAIFDEVESDPSIATASKAAEKAKTVSADVLIAIGGGSSIDAAKSAAVLVANGGYLKDYAGVGKVRKPPLPLIAIPTTAGTGSEITIFAVMTDSGNDEKFTISSPLIAPRTAILDAELTLKLPPSITAFTGMDALTHAVEAYCSVIAQPATDALAIQAMKMILKYLPVAVYRGDCLEARENMLQASLLAGISFSNALLGLSHAIASPLGAHFHVPHGLANAVMLPYVMEFNLPSAVEKYSSVAIALGLGTYGEPRRVLAERTVAAVTQLTRDINVPSRLREVGAKEDILPLVARDALKSIQLRFNPRVTTEQDILGVLRRAF